MLNLNIHRHKTVVASGLRRGGSEFPDPYSASYGDPYHSSFLLARRVAADTPPFSQVLIQIPRPKAPMRRRWTSTNPQCGRACRFLRSLSTRTARPGGCRTGSIVWPLRDTEGCEVPKRLLDTFCDQSLPDAARTMRQLALQLRAGLKWNPLLFGHSRPRLFRTAQKHSGAKGRPRLPETKEPSEATRTARPAFWKERLLPRPGTRKASGTARRVASAHAAEPRRAGLFQTAGCALRPASDSGSETAFLVRTVKPNARATHHRPSVQGTKLDLALQSRSRCCNRWAGQVQVVADNPTRVRGP